MANPFEVDVVNPLQALMLGQQSYSTGMENNKKQAQDRARTDAAALYSAGDTKGALAKLLSGGDLQGAGTYSTLDNNAWTRQHTTERDASSDRHQKLMESIALRQANRADEGVPEKAAERAKAASQYGLTPADPAFKAFVLTGALPDQEKSFSNTIEQRKSAAIANGLDPSSPGFQSFVLTGKMPREDAQPLTATDKKAILEADEGVMTNKAVVDALGQAQKISPDAHTGYLASARATLGNNLPDWLLPDAIASPKSAAATSNYDNIVLGQALSQLKSTFGAAPTEGERKILLELQASADKPDAVRQDILRRAKGLAENRLKFNEQRASELRGGSFYKANRTTAQASPSGQGNGADAMLAHAREAIAQGAPRDAVLQRLQSAGIDPSGL